MNTIRTDVRIFQVFTYDGDVILCNLYDAYELLPNCKTLKHYWNHKFERFGKLELKQMYANDRLSYISGEIENGRISYGEIAELESLKKFIHPSDTLLLEWAGVKERVIYVS